VNLDGTLRVLEAARKNGVRAVVYTSTMDVVMDGGPLVGIDEDQPYPDHYLDAYSESKALAEQAVLAANDANLRTVVLRACGIYGEADPYHMDSVLTAARDGKLTFRLGSADTVFEHVYVGNVAYAHALAAFAMVGDEPPPLLGNTYFVTMLVNSVSVQSTRLADDLGYQPRFTPGEAFERVITYYAPRFGKGF
jgi:nucleoside-diphosphate-sugar epimerase